jgi:hypothetical protein
MMMTVVLAIAAGCDTMEQDKDGQLLSIDNDPAYFLPGNDGYIDLGSRIVSPGKIRVEITGSTRNGQLKDLGKGLLQYSPFSGSSSDSFRFRVFSSDNRMLGEDSIGIIIPPDTTNLPCNYVYTRNDSVRNVTGIVTVNVLANDYSCFPLTVSVNVAPEHGTASVAGNKIQYVPGVSFTGRDQLLYKATSSDPSVIPGYGLLRIFGTDSVSNPGCVPVAIDDLFYKPKNDTSAIFFNVVANDTMCDSTNVSIASNPHHGYAWIDFDERRIGYRNFPTTNNDDTLRYSLCGSGGCATAKVVIKRQ